MTIAIEQVAERETGVAVVEADRDEVLAVLDARSQEDLGISGDEFLTRLHQGMFNDLDDPTIQRLVGIAQLLG